jgi:hypothetical protein
MRSKMHPQARARTADTLTGATFTFFSLATAVVLVAMLH